MEEDRLIDRTVQVSESALIDAAEANREDVLYTLDEINRGVSALREKVEIGEPGIEQAVDLLQQLVMVLTH